MQIVVIALRQSYTIADFLNSLLTQWGLLSVDVRVLPSLTIHAECRFHNMALDFAMSSHQPGLPNVWGKGLEGVW